MPVLDHRGARIHFEDEGEGPAIVLGHSFLCSGEMWGPQLPALREAHRVINVDFRGHGQSGRATGPLTLYDLVDDIVALLDHLGLERVVWGGLSIGGMVALRAALTVPQRVRGVMLLDTHAGAERTRMKVKAWFISAGVRLFGWRPFLAELLRLMFGRTTHRESPELIATWRKRFAANDVLSMLAINRALMRRDSVVPRLTEIAVPALVLVGEEDLVLPVSCSLQLDAALPDSRLVRIPGAGHLATLERPEPVTRAMIEFLATLSRDAP